MSEFTLLAEEQQKVTIPRVTLEPVDIYSLEHWKDYQMVDSKEDMLALLIILKMHGETLEEAHDVAEGQRKEICHYFGNCHSMKDVATMLLDNVGVYDGKEEYLEIARENYELDWTDVYSSFLEYVEHDLVSDCMVAACGNKIYRFIYC